MPDFTFQECETSEGRQEYRVDLSKIEGEPEVSPHVDPEQANLVIQFTDGNDSGPCITSRNEVGRFLAELSVYRSANA
jgi:hypothetical protein